MSKDRIKDCGTVLFGLIHAHGAAKWPPFDTRPTLSVFVSNEPDEERVVQWPLPRDWQLTLVRWSELQ